MLRLLLVPLIALLALAPAAAQDSARVRRQLSLENKPVAGDFDRMLERRVIRVLLPYSRTLYHMDKGHERGVTAELVREFEAHLNKKHAKRLGKRPLTVYVIVTKRAQLIPHLAQGLGDIAAGNITATEERRKLVDFAIPDDTTPVREVLVTGPGAAPVASLEDLAGKPVHVRKTTSYYASVLALNERLKKARKEPVKIVDLPDDLEDEDKLEMMNAGLFDYSVVDDWKGRMWAQILPKVKLREDIAFTADQFVGAAIRKGSPQLAAELKDFYVSFLKKQGGIAARQARYAKRVKQIAKNTGSEEMKRFQQTVQLFEKYGNKYSFDPLMLAAQGFQESRLNQNARSHVGAIGVMQIMPATGKELGVGDIAAIEPNIHGGAKYMDQLMTRYFADARFNEQERTLFAFASYNCGPGNVAKMRKEAEKRGLDPNKWFGDVEVVVGERIGSETTTYVRNIFKYYVAYKLATEASAAAASARQQLQPAKK
jgi:membrane-bound lytic murein transglycosylase MltF